MDKKLLDLHILIPGHNFDITFLNSFKDTLQAHPEIKITLAYESNVYTVRDRLLGGDSTRGKYQKPNTTSKYVLFIDSDAIWKPSDIERLYQSMEETGYAVITGWTKILGHENKYSPFFLVDDNWGTERSFRSTGKRLGDADIENLPDIFQVKITGGHFTMIRTDIFERLSYPWFGSYHFNAYGIDRNMSGEDTSFSLRLLEELGEKIYVDKRVKIGHLKAVDITGYQL